MACDSSIVRPIDSFIKYFGDIKPYHTKILEIVEQYVFREEISVEFEETPSFEITMANDPLCKGVGFGLNFDDDCGFDALDCCDLFECMGGFGLIFDNSDHLVSLPFSNINADQQISVPGSHLYDTFLNIKSVPDLSTIVVGGDQSAYFSSHELFWVVRKNSYNILTASGTTITVSGDHAAQLLAKINIEIQNAGTNDGFYGVLNATVAGGITTITLNRELPGTGLGNLLVESNSKNNGVYQIDSFTVIGGDTFLQLTPDTPAHLIDSQVETHGAVQLRTGLIPNRKVWIEGNSVTANNGEWKIIQAWYDEPSASTVLVVDGTLVPANSGTINIYGYETGAGFDGLNECSQPKPFNINAAISEFLTINIYDLPPPSGTPSPTPSVTPTLTVTPTSSVTPTPSTTAQATVTPTPSVTPTISLTPQPTVTPTPTVTAQATVTPTQSVTPTISLTPQATVTPTPTVTATVSLTPQATATPTATPSPSISATPSPSISATPAVTPTRSATPQPTPPVTPSSTPTQNFEWVVISFDSHPEVSPCQPSDMNSAEAAASAQQYFASNPCNTGRLGEQYTVPFCNSGDPNSVGEIQYQCMIT